MSGDPNPQPTDVLVRRLQRVAQWIDRLVESGEMDASPDLESLRARANTCWQAAGRLEDLAPVAPDLLTACRDAEEILSGALSSPARERVLNTLRAALQKAEAT